MSSFEGKNLPTLIFMGILIICGSVATGLSPWIAIAAVIDLWVNGGLFDAPKEIAIRCVYVFFIGWAAILSALGIGALAVSKS